MGEAQANLLKFARLMPKVELHVHLEGSIFPETVMELAKRNNIKLPVSSLENLRKMFLFSNFEDFLKVYMMISKCLKSAKDYELIAYEFGRYQSSQNCLYSEVTFSIATNVEFSKLSWEEILESLNAGRRRANEDFGVDWKWVLDIVRDLPATASWVVETALEAKRREFGVVALGLGGSEGKYPGKIFVEAFDAARSHGLACVPHAGEMSGADSVRNAVEELHAVRVGHGVRCVEDPQLVDVLVKRRIPLEVCVNSNQCLGIFDVRSHPIRKLWDAGVLVTVNSDDPALFGGTLCGEYELLVTRFGFSSTDLEQICLNAVRSTLLSPEDRGKMEAHFVEEFRRARAECGIELCGSAS